MAHTSQPQDKDAIIRSRLGSAIQETDLTSLGFEKVTGKVRDVYTSPTADYVLLVTTDRISAFDRILAHVPFKGQVLSEVSTFWFSQTKDIIENHILATPDPNVVVGKKCTVFPIEFVVRGYLTGTTSTSIWTNYAKGVRDYCGVKLADGLVQNQQLDTPLVTPTTKEVEHDRLISPEDIVKEGWMNKEDYDFCAAKALALFERGKTLAATHGLILVDTKYEFGRSADGKILVVDEIHTPDCSRYWLADSYDEKFKTGQSPDSIDKDVLRKWYNQNCDPYKDETLPKAPEDLIVTVATRYIELFERITGQTFQMDSSDSSTSQRIFDNVSRWMKSQSN